MRPRFRLFKGWNDFLLLILPGVCCLALQAEGVERRTQLSYSKDGKAGFTKLSPDETGITFKNMPEDSILNGSGVAAGDVDGDGLCDLYFCRLTGENVLYRNLGKWKFEDVTAKAAVACPAFISTGAVFADVDGDGDLDLMASSFESGTRLFLNDGKGVFKDETSARGLSMKGSATSMALADTDGDGDLDLYVAYIRKNRMLQMNPRFRFGTANGERVVIEVNGRPASDPDLTNRFTVSASGQVLEYGEPDIFYRNNGAGFFEPVSWTSGVFLDEHGKSLAKAPHDWGLAVQFYDINGDGAPDMYVCNDYFTPDRIWINQRNGTFKELPANALRTTSYSAMAVDFGDFNRDGSPDCYIVEMISRSYLRRQVQVVDVQPYYYRPGEKQPREQIQQNTLLLNRGDMTFAEIARYSGVEASEWSWCTIVMDVDMDGWEDILISNGHGRDLQNADSAERIIRETRQKGGVSPEEQVKLMMTMFEPLRVPKVAFRNNHDLTFTAHGEQWGFVASDVSHGMALADLDNDGDMDLVMNNLGTPAGIYRNNTPEPRVTVRLKGEGKNVAGVGSKIVVKTDLGIQRQEIICGGRYLSGDQMQRTFAAGRGKIDIEVKWPSGRMSKLENAAPDCLYEFAEAESTVPASVTQKTEAPLFRDVSAELGHRHVDEPFDDWDRQPSLPTTLSYLGPGITWHDYDTNLWPDLIIPTGRGGSLAVYQNDSGEFKRLQNEALKRVAARDQTTVLGLNQVLVAGSSNYEDGTTNGGLARAVDLLRAGSTGEILANPKASTGPMALADVNADGELDLFVGMRAISKRYPESTSSMIYAKKGNRFELLQTLDAGLVSGAVFSDVDGDGDSDLVLACVWGPIRVYRNSNGRFTNATESLGLSAFTGLWNGVATADFNNDGRPDIIASNWGKNSRWKASQEKPLKLYYGNFDQNETIDMVDAYYDSVLGREVPYSSLRFLGRALPELTTRMPTFAAFAAASLNQILNVQDAGQPLEVRTLATMVFLNGESGFTARELPPEAQFTPSFGAAVGDFNGDGNDDVFLAQNFFGTNLEMPRPDPGGGLLLLGDGSGTLAPTPASKSGLFAYGEQRGCASADFDRDGRLDLAVGQNSAETKLFRNQGSARGLAVTLIGSARNVQAVGAAVRYKDKSARTHFREMQQGSGYWSVNSSTLLLGPREEIKELEVRFPGKDWLTVKVPPEAWEITVDQAGKLQIPPPAKARSATPKFEPVRQIDPLDPVENPPLRAASGSGSELPEPEELVLGLAIENEARAYPLNMISAPAREVLNETLAGKPVVITWCSLCNNGVVYDRSLKGRTLTFAVEGSLWKSSMIMYDRETKSTWSQFLGRAMEGELKGQELALMPSAVMSWSAWKERYPNTSVVGYRRVVENYVADFRRQENKFVLGVVIKDETRAYALDDLKRQPVINDVVGSVPVVATFHSESTATMLFRREVNGAVLTFEFAGEDRMKDTKTQSVWDIVTGKCVSGTNKGQQLEALPATLAYVGAWMYFHPKTVVYGM